MLAKDHIIEQLKLELNMTDPNVCPKCLITNYQHFYFSDKTCCYVDDSGYQHCYYDNNNTIKQWKKLILRKCYTEGTINIMKKYVDIIETKPDMEYIFIECVAWKYDYYDVLKYYKEQQYDIFSNRLARLLDVNGIDALIKNNYDINTVYNGQRTLLIDCVLNILRTKDINRVNNIYLPLFHHLLNNGADSYKGNMLKYISGRSFKAEYKANLIKYLINNKLIDTTNRIIYNGKIFNDTRLGKYIASWGQLGFQNRMV